MHLRIWIWLSCVVLAGYVRATEDSVAAEPPADQLNHIQNDGHIPTNRDLFIDSDEGSGLETDESSGSGWGAGPGVDDEDGRGSGDATDELPEDDEDYVIPFDNLPVETVEKARKINLTGLAAPVDSESTDAPHQPETTATPVTEIPTSPPDTSPTEVAVPVNTKPNEGVVEEPRGAGENQPSRPDQTDINISSEDISPSTDQDQSGTNVDSESRPPEVFIMNAKPEDRATSFFAQPGILAAVIGGAVVGLLCAILVVMFIVYRMRKKDEGSYALDEPKRSPAAASYGKGHNNREFYA